MKDYTMTMTTPIQLVITVLGKCEERVVLGVGFPLAHSQ